MGKADRRARKRANRAKADADADAFIETTLEMERLGLARLVRGTWDDTLVIATDPDTGEDWPGLDPVPLWWLCLAVAPGLSEI